MDRKRILYVENGIAYGGAIVCLRHLVRNLDRTLYEPMVITGRTGPEYRQIAFEAPWKHIPDRHVDVIGLKNRLRLARWPDSFRGLRFGLQQLLARLDDLCNFTPFFLGVLFQALRFKPDIIHVNNEPLCNRAGILIGKLLRIPVVCHVRGDQMGSVMMKWMFPLPSFFIPVSRWVSDNIGQFGIAEAIRQPVYDGIEFQPLNLDADGLAFRRRFAIPETAFVVGLVGLLISWKGQVLLLDAVRLLLQDIPNLYAAIIGGTPDECLDYERELKFMAQAPEFQGRILFTGQLSQMAEVYNGLDVVLSASTSPEPLGTMIIEGMAMARPLIAPNHGGALEMLEHGVNGLLFNACDASDLAAQILCFYRDKALGEKLGKTARQQALARFSIDEHVKAVQKIYEKLLV